jgi:hypothetical protein
MVAEMTITPELSRILKTMVDAGRYSFPEAQARLAMATLTVEVSAACASTPAAQAAALTAVLTGGRCFPGGVWLSGAVDAPLILPLRASTLGEAAARFGARIGDQPSRRRISIGQPDDRHRAGYVASAWWDDWMAGVLPNHDPTPVGCGRNSLAGIVAGALAVGGAFRLESGHSSRCSPDAQRLSLWAPGSTAQGPTRIYLPDALWLVGLGNLGQAYLWSLSLLPYLQPEKLSLVLQDEDTVRDVNWGTSILVTGGRYGMLKTRLAEEWALERGFSVRRLDRFVDEFTRRRASDAPVALSGLDSINARRMLDEVGFDRVIDCGLGSAAHDYERFRLNVFDPAYGARTHFEGVEAIPRTDLNLRLPAYQDGLGDARQGACGMAELAGASVAAPYVSAVIAALAVTQAIRIASGEEHFRSIVGSVGNIDSIRTSGSDVDAVRVGFAEPRR